MLLFDFLKMVLIIGTDSSWCGGKKPKANPTIYCQSTFVFFRLNFSR